MSYYFAQVLQQLDEEGCARMAQVLRRLPQPNILVVGQADSYIMKANLLLFTHIRGFKSLASSFCHLA